MRKVALIGLAFVALGVGGCKRESEHEKLAKESIAMLNELADVLETVKDEESGKAALPKVEAIANKGEDLQKRIKAAPKLSKDEDDKLKAKYEPEAKKAEARLQAAGKPAFEKGGIAFALQIANLLKKFKFE